jgi:hypothetical protein
VFHRRDPAPGIFGLHVLYELRSSFGRTIFSSLTAFRPGHLYKFRKRCESTPTNIFLLARNKSIGVVLCCGVNVWREVVMAHPEITPSNRKSEWSWHELVVWCLVLVAVVAAAIWWVG